MQDPMLGVILITLMVDPVKASSLYNFVTKFSLGSKSIAYKQVAQALDLALGFFPMYKRLDFSSAMDFDSTRISLVAVLSSLLTTVPWMKKAPTRIPVKVR